jgi:UDP-glucuronate decarboxylase
MDFYTNSVVQKDLDFISRANLNFEKFRDSTVLITGINGMLATNLAYTFLFLNKKFQLNIKIVGLGRNELEFKSRFSDNLNNITFVKQDVNKKLTIKLPIDYIFHAATNASPENMVENPVSIALVNTIGTANVAEFALQKGATVHFLSTREVYGESYKDSISEEDNSVLNALDIRNVYPISKMSAEAMLLAYQHEYDLNVSISRIAHAYGPGMKLQNDGRVMADFLGRVIRNENIVLKSDGSAERSFLYVRDALLGILTIVLKSTKKNCVFNVSNEKEPITVKNLALLVKEFGHKFNVSIQVKLPLDKKNNVGYSNVKRTPLNTNKVEKLGWKPSVNLKTGIFNTLQVHNKKGGIISDEKHSHIDVDL